MLVEDYALYERSGRWLAGEGETPHVRSSKSSVARIVVYILCSLISKSCSDHE